MIRNQSHVLFINICSEGKPIIRYCLKVNAALEYELWWNGEVLENNCVNNAPDLLYSCSMVNTMISYLGSLKERNVTDEERLRGIIENIDDMEQIEQKKLSFYTEQLSLILIKDPRRRRYSCDLLTMACMWQNVSPSLCRQIKDESILTLPTAKYVRRLSCGLNVEAGYQVSDSTHAYHKAKKKKLPEKDSIVAILMDEVYVQKSVQYANGKFYGMEDNEVVKT